MNILEKINSYAKLIDLVQKRTKKKKGIKKSRDSNSLKFAVLYSWTILFFAVRRRESDKREQ